MGFPTKMFTVLFAIGRLPGWIAQWREMINDPETKIGRPRQLYTGPTQRAFVPIDDALQPIGPWVLGARAWRTTARSERCPRSGTRRSGAPTAACTTRS